MNLIAIDIGNSNIDIGLFLKDKEQFVKSVPGDDADKLKKCLKDTWEKIPITKRSKEGKRDGVIAVSSVKPIWTTLVRRIVDEELAEKILIIGKDIPYPIELGIHEKDEIGSDRVISAAAAYSVVESAVVIADFGSAVTIDLVDDRGVFFGGTIFPGFDASAKALKDNTAQLPQVKVSRPKLPFGKNTKEAINCGLYYSAVGALQEIIRRYAEEIGTWPRTVITGRAAEIIKDDCQFIDTYVANLVVKGIALAYRKWLESKE
ncbi:MAG: type III pantothenate kinase [Planctomycetota bacterium]|jgi:type III pantothenate kinase